MEWAFLVFTLSTFIFMVNMYEWSILHSSSPSLFIFILTCSYVSCSFFALIWHIFYLFYLLSLRNVTKIMTLFLQIIIWNYTSHSILTERRFTESKNFGGDNDTMHQLSFGLSICYPINFSLIGAIFQCSICPFFSFYSF